MTGQLSPTAQVAHDVATTAKQRRAQLSNAALNDLDAQLRSIAEEREALELEWLEAAEVVG